MAKRPWTRKERLPTVSQQGVGKPGPFYDDRLIFGAPVLRGQDLKGKAGTCRRQPTTFDLVIT